MIMPETQPLRFGIVGCGSVGPTHAGALMRIDQAVLSAVADLIPGLHRRPELRDTAVQALLIALGIAAIAVVRAVLAH